MSKVARPSDCTSSRNYQPHMNLSEDDVYMSEDSNSLSGRQRHTVDSPSTQDCENDKSVLLTKPGRKKRCQSRNRAAHSTDKTTVSPAHHSHDIFSTRTHSHSHTIPTIDNVKLLGRNVNHSPDSFVGDKSATLDKKSQVQESPSRRYAKRPRRKTKHNRYDVKVERDNNAARRYSYRKEKRNKRRHYKNGRLLHEGFRPDNIESDRLTIGLKRSIGLFSKSKWSSQDRPHDLPDFTFPEMTFLAESKHANHPTEGNDENKSSRRDSSKIRIEQLASFFASNEDGEDIAGTTSYNPTLLFHLDQGNVRTPLRKNRQHHRVYLNDDKQSFLAEACSSRALQRNEQVLENGRSPCYAQYGPQQGFQRDRNTSSSPNTRLLKFANNFQTRAHAPSATTTEGRRDIAKAHASNCTSPLLAQYTRQALIADEPGKWRVDIDKYCRPGIHTLNDLKALASQNHIGPGANVYIGDVNKLSTPTILPSQGGQGSSCNKSSCQKQRTNRLGGDLKTDPHLLTEQDRPTHEHENAEYLPHDELWYEEVFKGRPADALHQSLAPAMCGPSSLVENSDGIALQGKLHNEDVDFGFRKASRIPSLETSADACNSSPFQSIHRASMTDYPCHKTSSSSTTASEWLNMMSPLHDDFDLQLLLMEERNQTPKHHIEEHYPQTATSSYIGSVGIEQRKCLRLAPQYGDPFHQSRIAGDESRVHRSSQQVKWPNNPLSIPPGSGGLSPFRVFERPNILY